MLLLLKTYFSRQWNVSTFCILTERGRPARYNQEKCLSSNELIGNFPTLNNSRQDNEMCWLLDIRSLTNPLDLFISSHKTKGSVIPQKSRIGRMELVVWGFGECFTGQNQCKFTVHSCGVDRDKMCQHVWNNWNQFNFSFLSNFRHTHKNLVKLGALKIMWKTSWATLFLHYSWKGELCH